MKKTTVVRQNRCDREMNVLLYWCYFVFLAMQVFIGETDQATLVNGINMLLYLVFVPGFFFRLGYCFERISREKSVEKGKAHVRRMALILYACYVVLALAQMVIRQGLPFSYSFSSVLTFMEVPGSCAIFFSMAFLLLLVSVFYEPVQNLAGKPKKLLFLALGLALSALLSSKGEAYALMGSLFGAERLQTVPVVPYFAYFLLGIWFEQRKPGFSWELAGISGGITVVSLLLYRTPLQGAARVTASALPVYLVYAVSEGLSDVTLRFRAAKTACGTIGYVAAAYGAVLYFLSFRGMPEMAPLETVALALALTGLIYLVMALFWGFQVLCGRWERYFTERVKHRTAVYFLLFTAAYALLLFLAFFAFARKGRTLLWRADTISQYYPRIVYFVRYIRNLLASLFSGKFVLPMYDFTLGMGSEITYSMEPLYFLFALFGEEHVEFAYTLLILLRFYLAGVSFSVLCLYYKKDYFTTFIASCVYVFCGFSFYGGARHYMFMIPMILFPLLILSMEEILRGKRWYLCTIFVAVSLFSNYYFLYMCTIGMGIYFLVRFFCQRKEKRTVKEFFRKGFTIVGAYLLGVGMSCIVLCTTFGLYVGSGRNGASVIKTPSLFYYSAEWLVRCFMSFLTTAHSPGDWLKLGFLPVAFLALVLLFARRGRKELKIFSFIALVLMALPLSGYVFNGFSSISNRWCFMIALLVAFITAEMLPELRRLTRREKLILAGAVGIYAYLAFKGITLATWYTRIAAVCLAACLAVFLLCQEDSCGWGRPAKQSLVLLMTFCMVFVNGYTLYSSSGVVGEYTVPGEAKRKAENTPVRAVEDLEDDSFYRVSTPKLDYSTISSSMILDYNSVSVFNSTLNGSLMEYLEEMGATSYSATQLFGLGNRTFMNALASVKYYAYYDEPGRKLPYGYEEVYKTELEGQETTVCENQYALPLGYTYRDSISREELEGYDTLERQEVLMQRVMLEDGEEQGTEGIQTTLEPLELLSVKEEGLFLTEEGLRAGEPEEERESEEDPEEQPSAAEEGLSGEEESSGGGYALTVKFRGRPNSETYLVLKNAVLEGDMSERPINITFKTKGNKVVYKFRSDDDRYGISQEDYVFNLGYHEGEITTCTIRFDREGTIKFDSLELYSQPMGNLKAYTEALREDVLENVELGANEVSGAISLEEDKYLVLSIPYQNGWTAYVDGEETELKRANYAYMALPLSAGDHEIRLAYAIPGVSYALVVMPASAVLFAVILAAQAILRRKKKKKAARSGQ